MAIFSERRKSMKTKDLKLSSIDLAFKPPELYLGIDKVNSLLGVKSKQITQSVQYQRYL